MHSRTCCFHILERQSHETFERCFVEFWEIPSDTVFTAVPGRKCAVRSPIAVNESMSYVPRPTVIRLTCCMADTSKIKIYDWMISPCLKGTADASS